VDHMATRHGVSVEQATEAPDDPDAVAFDPDYASQSGTASARSDGRRAQDGC